MEVLAWMLVQMEPIQIATQYVNLALHNAKLVQILQLVRPVIPLELTLSFIRISVIQHARIAFLVNLIFAKRATLHVKLAQLPLQIAHLVRQIQTFLSFRTINVLLIVMLGIFQIIGSARNAHLLVQHASLPQILVNPV